MADAYLHRPHPDHWVGKYPNHGVTLSAPLRKGTIEVSDELWMMQNMASMTPRHRGQMLGFPSGTEVSELTSRGAHGSRLLTVYHHHSLPHVQEGEMVPVVGMDTDPARFTPPGRMAVNEERAFEEQVQALLDETSWSLSLFGWTLRIHRS